MTSVSVAEILHRANIHSLRIPKFDGITSNLEASLLYAEAGWFVLPVRRGTKNPGSVVGSGWPKHSSRDPKIIMEWFRAPNFQIALHIGRSGALAIDVDNPEKLTFLLRRELPKDSVPFQGTRNDDPQRGHYLFRTDGNNYGNGVGRLGEGWGDVRGTNGVILAFPSEHPAGGKYEWHRGGALPTIPIEIAKLLPKSTRPRTTVSPILDIHDVIEAWSSNEFPSLLERRLVDLTKEQLIPGTRHRLFLNALRLCMSDARCGFYPASRALDEIHGLFEISKKQDEQTPNEFVGMARWAIETVEQATSEQLNLHAFSSLPLTSPEIHRWLESQINAQ